MRVEAYNIRRLDVVRFYNPSQRGGGAKRKLQFLGIEEGLQRFRRPAHAKILFGLSFERETEGRTCSGTVS